MRIDPSRRRRSIRLEGYDYSQPGGYFLTICAFNRECLFGGIIDGVMVPNGLGQIVAEEWMRAPLLRKEIQLDEWVIMPNHLHRIVLIHVVAKCEGEHEWRQTGAHSRAPLQRRPRSLSSLVAQFKASATRRINETRGTPGAPVWQRNYHEHIIRSEESLEAIREYIVHNPLRWAEDEENPANVKTGQ